MKDYVVSYGYEVEWGDIDRSIDIPSCLGSWEGPKMSNGYYAGAERDINNSDGTLCDPLCETTTEGGEINVRPALSIDDIVGKVADLKQLFKNPYAGIVNHGHLHVYAPKIDMKKLEEYTKKYEKELIDICYDCAQVITLYENGEIDRDTYEYLMYDGGRLNSFDGRRSLQHDTGEETSSPRAAVNLWNLTKGKTIEFRCFRSTTDISIIRNTFLMAREFINQSQVDNGLSPWEIAVKYDLVFPKLPTDVVIKHFIRDRHDKKRGDPYKYMDSNPNIWREPFDFSFLEEVKSTLAQKAEDYGNMSNEPFIKERTVTNLYNKAMRLCNLVFNKKDANFESEEDTVKDMVGYCILYMNNSNRNSNDAVVEMRDQ